MICLSMYSNNPSDYKNLPTEADIIELRLDLNNFNFDTVKEILEKSDKKIIVTDKNIDVEKEALLNDILELKPDYTDIDINTDEQIKKRLIAKAKKTNTSLILSYHNYEITPSINKLECVIRQCTESGADIIKIACKVNNSQDNSKMLSLYNRPQKILSIGMGEKGRITRIAGLFLGAPWTYVNLVKENTTAPGQYNLKTMLSIINTINYAG